MAATHASASSSSTFLARTRSARVPANTGRPLGPPSVGGGPGAGAGAGTGAGGGAAAAGGHTTGGGPAPQPISGFVSNVSLFLTNLHLLDLDLHPDWPDINRLTFTARDAAQGQKKRIQCVEWALYQLFDIWDPDETRARLDPFFPPYDQVQSLNLRAVLLRALEQAKKNGVLGRDAVVRKTMLDECKGERLEEVLAVFSSAVLKKVIAENQLNDWHYPAISQVLALENRSYTQDRTELYLLVLAHKASLSKLLREKKVAGVQFRDFAELLASKERDITRRREQVRATEKARASSGQDTISEEDRQEVWQTVRHNWSGNERWMETLFYGDSGSQKDGLLAAPFDRVWRRVQSGRLNELEVQHGSGLLEQLDGRVRAQKERLERWESFREKMFGKTSEGPAEKAPEPPERQTGINLGFRAHEGLRVGRMRWNKPLVSKPATLGEDYASLLDGLHGDLEGVGASVVPAVFSKTHPTRSEPTPSPVLDPADEPRPVDEVISELGELEEEFSRLSISPRPSSPRSSTRSLRNASSGSEKPLRLLLHQRSSTLPSSITSVDDDDFLDSPSFGRDVSRDAYRRTSVQSSVQSPIFQSPIFASTPPRAQHPAHSQIRTYVRSPDESPNRTPTRASTAPQRAQMSLERPVSPTQRMADQILASMDNASPSPLKQHRPRHTLSLAERTRLSMARHPHASGFSDDEPEPEPSALPPTPDNLRPRSPEKILESSEDEYEDLVARTRRSMANFDQVRQKAQLERRRSQRESRQPSRWAEGSSSAGNRTFSPVDEGDSDGDGDGDTTLMLTEQLLSVEDEATIFMSRPKVKTSPMGSPPRW